MTLISTKKDLFELQSALGLAGILTSPLTQCEMAQGTETSSQIEAQIN